MADWMAIKTEYITTDTSYRDLAAKYGLNYRTIADRGKSEGWVELRNQYVDKTQSDIADASRKLEVERATKFQNVADKLLGKIEDMVDDDSLLDAKSIRTLSAALKDLKEVKGVMSDLDRQEQEARIANLQRQAAMGDDKGTSEITVRLMGGLDDYAK